MEECPSLSVAVFKEPCIAGQCGSTGSVICRHTTFSTAMKACFNYQKKISTSYRLKKMIQKEAALTAVPVLYIIYKII